VAGGERSSDSGGDYYQGLQFSNKKRWTLQSIVEHHEKEKINNRAEELSNAERGSAQFLGSYRRARTEICNSLSQQDHQRYLALVGKWNAEPVPVNVQRE